MGLEHWDTLRRKWVLYRSQAQHSVDCARYPFESIPRKVFLDTNQGDRVKQGGDKRGCG